MSITRMAGRWPGPRAVAPRVRRETTGDTSPDSAFEADPFLTGSGHHYERTLAVSKETAASLRVSDAVVVVHGFDYNRKGKYDFNLGKSPLGPMPPPKPPSPPCAEL
ncbi:hypothetical protein E4198_01375 [Streptomyces sp. RKND-216]|uniref:hypothetical protein n=1 Tax=Streptomyces sp. RKND-216 TaxID=2562581 RepID=UPI00109E1C0D|nr:hypothetical protein [Streptomyces sp. RKND-216]THA23565.1 hypothetical protein E4198_01375 [Streptomyces sp. RKND-216]